MDVNFGTQVGFLQELVSINVPTQQQEQHQQPGTRATGDMSVLGRVRHRLVVTPDWNKLFNIESIPDPDSSNSDDEDEVLPTWSIIIFFDKIILWNLFFLPNYQIHYVYTWLC